MTFRFLFIPLFDAERAWSYAMQLKEEANTEPRKRFHLVSRMRKAVDHSESLVTLCESEKCDARTKLEAQAYNAFLKGSLHFEQEHWKTAIEHFNKAQYVSAYRVFFAYNFINHKSFRSFYIILFSKKKP